MPDLPEIHEDRHREMARRALQDGGWPVLGDPSRRMGPVMIERVAALMCDLEACFIEPQLSDFVRADRIAAAHRPELAGGDAAALLADSPLLLSVLHPARIAEPRSFTCPIDGVLDAVEYVLRSCAAWALCEFVRVR